jgi:peroxiredoxin
MGNIETVEAFGNIQSIPTTFVIDQDGFIVKTYVGYRPQSVFEKDVTGLLNTDG